MSEPSELTQIIAQWSPLVKPLLLKLPFVLGLLAISLVGYLVAGLVNKVMPRLIDKVSLEALAERYGVSRALYAIGYHKGFGRFCGQLSRYVVLLITLQIILSQLQLLALSSMLEGAMAKLPELLSATLILFATWMGADLCAKQIKRLSKLPSPAQDLISQGARGLIITLGALIALEQVGLNTDQLNAIIEVVVAIIALALSVGFALGARFSFRHLIAKHYAKALLRVGDRVSVAGEFVGEFVRFEWLYVVLKDKDGAEHLWPCASLMGQPFAFQAQDEA